MLRSGDAEVPGNPGEAGEEKMTEGSKPYLFGAKTAEEEGHRFAHLLLICIFGTIMLLGIGMVMGW